MEFTQIEGGVTAVPGFLACGVHAGLKKDGLDIAMIYNPVLCSCAGVFTSNKIKAAPLLVTMDKLKLKHGYAHGIVINSGNANACTGISGFINAKNMCAVAANRLGTDEDYILVASTGVIGEPLPMDKITKGIELAVKSLSKSGGHDAAKAIMTTDLTVKEFALSFEIDGKKVHMGGMAKGSGMIHPNMATMLAYITTDISISPDVLKKALREVTDDTFNMITVDGDTSTNDMVVVFASGEAGNAPIIEDTSKGYEAFVEALRHVCTALAKDIARDGEGATTLIEVNVKNALTKRDAKLAAKSVVGSNLFKAAVFGKDANWGRIICAFGYSGAGFDPGKVDIYIGDIQVARDGAGIEFDEERAKKLLSMGTVSVTVDFKQGDAEATAWGCDLSYDYVRINASYRT